MTWPEAFTAVGIVVSFLMFLVAIFYLDGKY